MKTHFITSVVTFLALVISPAFADVADLNRLKTSYEAACTRVTAPLTTAYVSELQKLLRLKQQAGNPGDIAAVTVELKRMGVNIEVPTPAPGQPAKPAAAETVERFFVGKTWETPAGTKFEFGKNGLGKRVFGKDETQFVWTRQPDNLVHVQGESTKGGAIRTWYFRFVSLTEAYYGDNNTPGQKLERK